MSSLVGTATRRRRPSSCSWPSAPRPCRCRSCTRSGSATTRPRSSRSPSSTSSPGSSSSTSISSCDRPRWTPRGSRASACLARTARSPFLLGEGHVAVYTSHYYIDNGQKDETESWLDTFAGMDEPPSPFEWELAGRPIAFLLVECAGYFALLVATRIARRDVDAVVDALVDAVAARVGRRPAGRPLFERGADGEERRGRGLRRGRGRRGGARRRASRRLRKETFDVVLDELVKAYPKTRERRRSPFRPRRSRRGGSSDAGRSPRGALRSSRRQRRG